MLIRCRTSMKAVCVFGIPKSHFGKNILSSNSKLEMEENLKLKAFIYNISISLQGYEHYAESYLPQDHFTINLWLCPHIFNWGPKFTSCFFTVYWTANRTKGWGFLRSKIIRSLGRRWLWQLDIQSPTPSNTHFGHVIKTAILIFRTHPHGHSYQ